MALTPEQIKELRTQAGLSPDLPAPGSPSQVEIDNRLAEFDDAIGFTEKKPSFFERGKFSESRTGQPKEGTVGKGLEKGTKGFIQGLGELGAKVLPGAEEVTPEYVHGTPENTAIREDLKAVGGNEKLGKTITDILPFFLGEGETMAVEKALTEKGTQAIPEISNILSKVVGERAPDLAKKIVDMGAKSASQGINAAEVVAAQSGGDIKDVTKAAAAGATIPIVAPVGKAFIKPVTALAKNLFKGLGSGLSGVSTDAINHMFDNPKYAQRIADEIEKSGQSSILEKNAKSVIDGVSQIRQEARTAYGKGLEELKKVDIKPSVFRENIQDFFDRYGISSKGGSREFDVEFDDPKNLQKASDLIDKITKSDLDGTSLRKLVDDIDSMKYKTATSDERLSFNAFLRDMSDAFKTAINKSTDKLDTINKAYSDDLQIAEAIEDIFGNVSYKNLPELLKASQKLENLFSQQGLSNDVVDKFLNRININPSEFRTSEAVRQISNKASGSNSKGLSAAEIIQQVTSAIVTPKMVRDIAILTGRTADSLKDLPKLLNSLDPATRGAIVEALIKNTVDESENNTYSEYSQ